VNCLCNRRQRVFQGLLFVARAAAVEELSGSREDRRFCFHPSQSLSSIWLVPLVVANATIGDRIRAHAIAPNSGAVSIQISNQASAQRFHSLDESSNDTECWGPAFE
jgi:hypothetical protein